jgi:hypothetical protein
MPKIQDLKAAYDKVQADFLRNAAMAAARTCSRLRSTHGANADARPRLFRQVPVRLDTTFSDTLTGAASFIALKFSSGLEIANKPGRLSLPNMGSLCWA